MMTERYTQNESSPTTAFYRMPKVLFTDSCFREMSLSAKLLYALLLDRLSLSSQNEWRDEEGQVFLYFTMEEAQERLGCGHSKAVRLFAELESSSLIRRKRQGQGKPMKIYVENLLEEVPFSEVQTADCEPSDPAEERAASENQQSAAPENSSPDCPKPDANQTEKNKIEMIKTDRIYPPYIPPFAPPDLGPEDRTDGIDAYRSRIRANIEYDILTEQCPNDRELIDSYVELMAEACASSKDRIRISREEFPAEVVRSRFLKLNSEHIRYVLDCMNQTSSHIGNIKAYTLAALYNAPVTMDQYYTCLVSRDFAGGGAKGGDWK